MSRLLGALGAASLALFAAACSRRTEPAPAPPARATLAAPLDEPRVLATLPDDVRSADPAPAGLGLHPVAPRTAPEFVFSARGGGVAWVEERDGTFRVVHNGRAGAAYAAVGTIAVSPDGRRCAHGALVGGKWRMVVDGKEGQPFSAVRAPAFSPDGAHLAYQAMSGERWHLVVDGKVNGGTSARYVQHEFSGDSSRIALLEDAAGEGRGELSVSDLAFERTTVVGVNASSLALDGGRTRIAAVVARDGGQRVITLAFDAPEQVRVGPAQGSVFGLTFGPDGRAVTYRAVRSNSSFVVLDEEERPQPFAAVVGQAVQPGREGVGALVVDEGAVHFHRFFAEGSRDEGPWDEAEGLIYSDDGRLHAYAARRGASWFLVVNGQQGPPFDRVVSPVFSPDGERVAYRARKDGKRFVVTADTSGRTVRQHPPYEQVFPVRFTADGKSIAYGVKDGRQLAWKVEAP